METFSNRLFFTNIRKCGIIAKGITIQQSSNEVDVSNIRQLHGLQRLGITHTV